MSWRSRYEICAVPTPLLAARNIEIVPYAGWETIDALEQSRGEPQGRPRVKLCRWDELLEVARKV